MKIKTFGIVLIILGIIMMVYTGFNFVTSEKVIEIGSLKLNSEKNHHVQWPPIVGALLLVGGIVLVVIDRKDRS
jgi:uncharacterized membrane protein YdcZ (DUF606 family)